MRFGITAILAGAIALSGAQMLSAQAGGAVKAAIDASNKKFGAAIAAGDAKAVGAIYTDDATVMPPNSEAVKGRQAIEGLFGMLVTAGIKGAVLTAQEVEVHGDTATEVGTYAIQDATGKEIDRGKYVATWKRVKGEWKMHRDIWNSNLPVAAPK
jgi:uncharacterized protein (TIGR02246 family)